MTRVFLLTLLIATTTNAEEMLPANLFVRLAKQVTPSVVNIWTQNKQSNLPQRKNRDPFYDLLEQFMPMPIQPNEAMGTGFVIRKDGLIITNAHVVQDAEVIKVQFVEKGKKSYRADVIGADMRTDIALLKIKSSETFPIVELGNSKKIQVGEWVAAFGNPLGLGHTMTKGIISAIGREITELNRLPFIQTDASINPGNSGGPLVNTKGQVIGVNSAIAQGNGIGFAIPIDDVKFIIEKLEKDGRIIRGFIGVAFAEITDEAANYFKLKEKRGLLVQTVQEDGPADNGGVEAGDILMTFAGRKLFTSQDLVNAVANSEIGSRQKVEVLRNGKRVNKTIKIGTHPEDKKAANAPRQTMRSKNIKGEQAPFDLGFFIEKTKVIKIVPNSPADMGGLQVGDIIKSINQKEIRKSKDIHKFLVNGANALTVSRKGGKTFLFIESSP